MGEFKYAKYDKYYSIIIAFFDLSDNANNFICDNKATSQKLKVTKNSRKNKLFLLVWIFLYIFVD